MKKYQLLTADTKMITHPKTKLPTKLYRIIALKTWNRGIIRINEGDIGGYIQSEENLRHDDDSWVFHDGMIFDNATLADTIVMQRAAVFGEVKLNNCMVKDYTRIFDNVRAKDSQFSGNTDAYGNAVIEFCNLNNSCIINGNTHVSNTKLYHGAMIGDSAIVSNSTLHDTARILGNSNVENCKLTSSVCIFNETKKNETLSRDIILNQSYPEIANAF